MGITAPAFAANECGTAVAGDTVTCNADGAPASDASPYASGITYAVPVNLIIDGTVNPITSNGRIGITAASGVSQSVSLLGDVNINLINPASNVPAIGNNAAFSGNITFDIGAGTNILINQAIGGRTVYGVRARTADGLISATSLADMDIISTDATNTSPVLGYYFQDTAGASPGINATIGGSIDMTLAAAGTSAGIQTTLSNTPDALTTINSSAVINLTVTDARTGSAYGIYADANNSGDIHLTSSGAINLDLQSLSSEIATALRGRGDNIYINSYAPITVTNNGDTSSTTYGILSTATDSTNIFVGGNIDVISSSTAGAGNTMGVSTSSTSPTRNITIADNIRVSTQSLSGNTYSIYLASGNQNTNITIGENSQILSESMQEARAITTGGNALTDISHSITTIGNGTLLSSTSDSLSQTAYVRGGTYDFILGNNVEARAISNDVSYVFNFTNSAGGMIDIGAGSVISATGTNSRIAIAGSAAADLVTATDTTFVGDMLMGAGDDDTLLIGGSLDGGVDMGDDDDVLFLSGMDLSAATHLLGGIGEDSITFDGITHSGASLASDNLAFGTNLGDGWETISFANTRWALTGNLTLGGSTVNIDSASTLYAGNGVNSVISSIIPNDPATVNNAGIIDLTNGASGTTDTLTIRGHYVGQNGQLLLNTIATGATMDSDTLIIDGSSGGGSASGTTAITIFDTSNITTPSNGNGILLVQFINGATSAPGAFTLSNPRITVGAYDFTVRQGNDLNWYLASNALPRDEIIAYNALPDTAHRLGLAMMGNDWTARRLGAMEGRFWARGFGADGRVGAERSEPGYDYAIGGGQAGIDLYQSSDLEKTQTVAGLYAGMGRASLSAASTSGHMNGYAFGAYWLRQQESGLIIDAALQGMTYDDVSARSAGGTGLTTNGLGAIASVGAGMRHDITDIFDMPDYITSLSATPMLRLSAQTVKLDDAADAYGRMDFSMANAVYAQFAQRWAADIDVMQDNRPMTVWLQPAVSFSLSSGAETAAYDPNGSLSARFDNDLGGTQISLGAGIAKQVANQISVFTAADFAHAVGREGYNMGLQAGFKMRF